MADVQEKKIANINQNNLIDTQSRAINTMRDGLKSVENTRKLSRHPDCEVMISFTEKPDEAAIADVLRMLMSTGSRR